MPIRAAVTYLWSHFLAAEAPHVGSSLGYFRITIHMAWVCDIIVGAGWLHQVGTKCDMLVLMNSRRRCSLVTITCAFGQWKQAISGFLRIWTCHVFSRAYTHIYFSVSVHVSVHMICSRALSQVSCFYHVIYWLLLKWITSAQHLTGNPPPSTHSPHWPTHPNLCLFRALQPIYCSKRDNS